MSRLEQLLALRKEIDAEIERERAAVKRSVTLARQVCIVTTRGSWNTRVFAAVCQHYGGEDYQQLADKVMEGRRDRVSLDARHSAWWLMRDAGRTYTEIADEFGVDHTSVINGVRRISGAPTLLATAQGIRERLTGEEAA